MRDGAPLTEAHAPNLRTVTLPFIVFTAIWGSTWIVIRGQLGVVPPQWSVTYRFIIAAIAMVLLAMPKGGGLRLRPPRFIIAASAVVLQAMLKGEGLRLGPRGLAAAVFLGFTQFCVNFNAV